MTDSSNAQPTSRAAAMADAAGALLDSFDRGQRQKAQFPFPSNDERRLWFYTPTDHGGLALTDMSPGQHRMVFRLLATGLSAAGYATTAIVVGQDNILDYVEDFSVDFGRERGRDPSAYFIAVFGEPGSSAWSWRFGGHHVSLHFTIADGAVVSATPCFLGADPANTALLGPHMHRPLAGAEDLARDVVHMLSDEQRAAATVSAVPPSDLVGSNRTVIADGDWERPLTEVWRGRFESEIDQLLAGMQARVDAGLGVTDHHRTAVSFSATPKGLLVADMGAGEREAVHALLATYIGRIHDDLADAQWAKVAAAADQMRFLWAGGIEPGQPHYYRIHGGDLFVEYDNTFRGANHIHTVWRDLSLDFGGDPLAAHYASPHSHH